MKNSFKLLVTPDEPFPMPPLREIGTHYITDKSMPHLEALITLRRRAIYHQKRLNNCLDDPLIETLKHNLLRNFDAESISAYWDRMFPLMEIIDAELIAMMQALHSQYDVFAQVINAEIINLSPNDVYYKKINKQLTEFPDLKLVIENIKGHEHFRYLDDLINTNKHIFTPRIEFDINGIYLMDDISIESFDRNNTSHAETKIRFMSHELKSWVDSSLKRLSVSLKSCQITVLEQKKNNSN
ncbi:hypothetical protein [Peribacillus sp. AS_2]|uniref:hypothetical protein n=1 Tax=Peribacillus sp. AS_2 TaxID=2996755 RepID=UPI0022A756B8|nr:hypothetical protein [Peribacillus sp. AS_2]MCZ0872749.1 hypothetical protein [Peribacillus sp. AS_2]